MLAHEVKSKDERTRVVRTACFLDVVFLFFSEEAFDRAESLNRQYVGLTGQGLGLSLNKRCIL